MGLYKVINNVLFCLLKILPKLKYLTKERKDKEVERDDIAMLCIYKISIAHLK